jgi:ADP-ribose pyrophosphatase YjhB (NUDIX family)
MWIFTAFGFFSVVRKNGDSFLTVRARVASDLERLRKQFMPHLSATIIGKGTDYPYRATISHEDFALGMASISRQVDYGNFKNEIYQKMGSAREKVYSEVWGVLRNLETGPEMKKKSRLGKEIAYGGVVINDQGKILLREPSDHFDGYVWTFPKGRPSSGESPEETARREVQEETGVIGEIIEQLSGSFDGGTTENVYFLMSFVKDTGRFDKETQSICWATPAEAKRLILETTNKIGRERDLRVLEDAMRISPE